MRPETLRPELAHADEFDLCGRRVHEAEGRGRRTFALFQAVRHPGPLVWILPAHMAEGPMLRGLPQGVGDRLHLLRPANEADLLWCIEEALRAAPVGLVIAEPAQPLSLTAGRRFQLAAEAGRSTGLILIRQDAGSNATETRWHCNPIASPQADSTLHHWSLKKNKKGTLRNWIVNWNGASAAFHMVSEAGERYQPAEPAR
jgi:protein ImuA